MTDQDWMRLALDEARLATREQEVPVGALLVKNERIIGRGHNSTIAEKHIAAHAEIVAMQQASSPDGVHALAGATLFVTLEPCLMCLGALVHARISRLVFGAYEPMTGALISHYQLADYPGHGFDWSGGILQDECAGLLQEFFRNKRREAGS